MYYHTSDKKLSYTKPVWMGNHQIYIKNFIESKLNAQNP